MMRAEIGHQEFRLMTSRLYRDFRTVEELDAEYAIHLSVADFEYYVRSYTERSAAFRDRVSGYYDLKYGPTKAEAFDLFSAGKGTPLVVFIHGGYWYMGSKNDFSFVAEGLLKNGVSVVIEDYALCPYVSMTEIVRQHRALIAHLYRNAGSLNINRDNIIVCGHSAGGHAALEVGRTDWAEYDLPKNTVIPTCIDHDLCAQSRRPMDIIFQG